MFHLHKRECFSKFKFSPFRFQNDMYCTLKNNGCTLSKTSHGSYYFFTANFCNTFLRLSHTLFAVLLAVVVPLGGDTGGAMGAAEVEEAEEVKEGLLLFPLPVPPLLLPLPAARAWVAASAVRLEFLSL